jgi:hypothetical protein
MTKVGDTAKVRLSGSHVDHRSPIEDQVIEVYRAAKRYADANKFKMHIHNGPYGSVRGVAGPMILKRLVKQLFPGYTDDEFNTAYSVINQALRKTDACVCLKRPRPHADDPNRHDPNDMPVWFIRDKQPGNLVVVTLAQAKRSADVTNRPTGFNENEFLTPRERRLDKHAAGEDLPPGEVTVKTKGQEESMSRAEVLQKGRDVVIAEHLRLVQRVLEELETNPVPLTADDMVTIINQDDEFDYTVGAYRDAAKELVDAGHACSRKETADERRVRGGGRLPKGGSRTLFAAGTGPVPTRTQLPVGVEPARAASEWNAEMIEQRYADQEKIIEALKTLPRDHRTRGRLLEITGIGYERFQAAADRLIRDNVVYMSSYRYYLRESGRGTRSTKTPNTEAGKSLPSVATVDTVQTVPSPTAGIHGDDDGDLALVQRLAAKLGVELPRGDERRVAELEKSEQTLRQEISDLESENERLKSQVATLKAAINALT